MRNVYTALCVHWDHHPVDAAQHYGAGTDAEQIRRLLAGGEARRDPIPHHRLQRLRQLSLAALLRRCQAWWATRWRHGHTPALKRMSRSGVMRPPSPANRRSRIPNGGASTAPASYRRKTSVPNSRWTEAFFIPLLLEILDRYHPVHFWLDGAWLPGNREDACFCEYCQERFADKIAARFPNLLRLRTGLTCSRFTRRHSTGHHPHRAGR